MSRYQNVYFLVINLVILLSILKLSMLLVELRFFKYICSVLVDPVV